MPDNNKDTKNKTFGEKIKEMLEAFFQGLFSMDNKEKEKKKSSGISYDDIMDYETFDDD